MDSAWNTASGNADWASARDAGYMLRCIIIDDSPYFREAARRLLEGQGVAVVGVACDSAQTLRG
jgi:hypothetical protein